MLFKLSNELIGEFSQDPNLDDIAKSNIATQMFNTNDPDSMRLVNEFPSAKDEMLQRTIAVGNGPRQEYVDLADKAISPKASHELAQDLSKYKLDNVSELAGMHDLKIQPKVQPAAVSPSLLQRIGNAIHPGIDKTAPYHNLKLLQNLGVLDSTGQFVDHGVPTLKSLATSDKGMKTLGVLGALGLIGTSIAGGGYKYFDNMGSPELFQGAANMLNRTADSAVDYAGRGAVAAGDMAASAGKGTKNMLESAYDYIKSKINGSNADEVIEAPVRRRPVPARQPKPANNKTTGKKQDPKVVDNKPTNKLDRARAYARQIEDEESRPWAYENKREAYAKPYEGDDEE